MFSRVIPLMCVISLLLGSLAFPPTAEAAVDQRAAFITKLQNLVFPALSQAQIAKIVDRIGEGLYQEKSLENITHDVRDAIIVSVPSAKYLSLLNAFSQLDSAIKKCGSNTDQIASIVSSTVQKHLKSTYTTVVKKVVTLKKKGKTLEQIQNQIYSILTATLTKAFIQSIVTALAKDLRACEGNAIQRLLQNIGIRVELYQ